MANVRTKGENFYRDAKAAKRVKDLRDTGVGKYNVSGSKEISSAPFQSKAVPTSARIEPHRKWFGNTRVISQEALSGFREAMAAKRSDPYAVLLKTNKLPMSLLDAGQSKDHVAKVRVEAQPFATTFGPKAQRKRPKIDVASMGEMASHLLDVEKRYREKLETDQLLSGKLGEEERAAGVVREAREHIFSKGQSKRIWNELYKVGVFGGGNRGLG